jgi:hypothetical protein
MDPRIAYTVGGYITIFFSFITVELYLFFLDKSNAALEKTVSATSSSELEKLAA